MSHKSALTAALAGDGEAGPTVENKMDASAFPCVGIDKASGHDDVLRSLDDLDVDLTALPGSQATAKASGDKFVVREQ